MTEDWPPDGYSDPREYQKNERYIFAIGFALIGAFGVAAWPPITNGVTVYTDIWTNVAINTGMSDSLLVPIASVVTFITGMVFLFKILIVPFHEGVHYVVGLILDINPNFGYEKGTIFKNPRVVALSTGIPVWKNLFTVISPFVIIGSLSWVVVQLSGGLLAGVAAIVFWINSAASAQDLYHYFRLLRMNPKAKFANFKTDEEIRTEYVIQK